MQMVKSYTNGVAHKGSTFRVLSTPAQHWQQKAAQARS